MSKASDWSWPVSRRTRRGEKSSRLSARLFSWAVSACGSVGNEIDTFIVIPCAIGEIPMFGYLLAIGVKTKKPNDERILARPKGRQRLTGQLTR